jgi:hypothetical protein
MALLGQISPGRLKNKEEIIPCLRLKSQAEITKAHTINQVQCLPDTILAVLQIKIMPSIWE